MGRTQQIHLKMGPRHCPTLEPVQTLVKHALLQAVDKVRVWWPPTKDKERWGETVELIKVVSERPALLRP